MTNFTKIIFASLVLALVSSCGGVGNGSGGGGASSSLSEVTGTIISQTGNTGDFDGWIILLVSAETGEARTSEIDSAGKYSFKQVDKSDEYTLVMLNTDFRLTTVLSIVAADVTGSIYQWFEIESSTLPRLVQQGSIMEFSSEEGITVSTATASDSDGDGIPDGMDDSTSLVEMMDKFPLATIADADGDGIANETDPDIDGDGLPNGFDGDDDDNGTLDVFDLDANADLVTDKNQTIGDHYFDDEVEYIAVQLLSEPDSVKKIRMIIKISDSISPKSIIVQGSQDLFDESVKLTAATDGEEEGEIWDRYLKDDGTSFDENANDNLYSMKVKLKTGKEPEADQVILISLNMGTYTKEFPFTFPDLTTGSVSFSYASSSDKITKSGSPYGSSQTSYYWSVSVFDDAGDLVHPSGPNEGASSTYTIDSDDIPSGTDYSAIVYAQALEKVSGYPVYVVESSEKDL